MLKNLHNWKQITIFAQIITMEDIFIKNEKGEIVRLDEVDNIEALREVIRENQRHHSPTLSFKAPLKNDIEVIKQLISLVYEFLVLNGKHGTKMSEKYKTTLSIYLLYGYSKESKIMVQESLNLKSISSVNSINNELRNLGLLIKDYGNSRNSSLCREFQALQTFIQKTDKQKSRALKITWLR